MEQFMQFITGHADLTFSLAVAFGAVMHFWKKKYRGEMTNTFLGYWLFDNPANSLGAAGALAVVIFGAIGTGTLDGATWQLILTSGFAAGWAIDSGVNKGGSKNANAV